MLAPNVACFGSDSRTLWLFQRDGTMSGVDVKAAADALRIAVAPGSGGKKAIPAHGGGAIGAVAPQALVDAARVGTARVKMGNTATWGVGAGAGVAVVSGSYVHDTRVYRFSADYGTHRGVQLDAAADGASPSAITSLTEPAQRALRISLSPDGIIAAVLCAVTTAASPSEAVASASVDKDAAAAAADAKTYTVLIYDLSDPASPRRLCAITDADFFEPLAASFAATAASTSGSGCGGSGGAAGAISPAHHLALVTARLSHAAVEFRVERVAPNPTYPERKATYLIVTVGADVVVYMVPPVASASAAAPVAEAKRVLEVHGAHDDVEVGFTALVGRGRGLMTTSETHAGRALRLWAFAL
jgi:hypothetical protein